MPTTVSPLKRPSAGGRLRRLLSSLRPPARPGGPLPVQTGFPTSLADLVVKNHDRLKKPRRRHRPTPAPSLAVSAAEPAPQQRRELPVAPDTAAPAPAAFSIRPELLAVGGVMALALLVIWSKLLVAAATAASVALFWIESSRRRPSSETKRELDSRGRGLVSPIREASESPAETPRSSSAASDDTGSEVSASLWAATDIAGDDPDSIIPTSKRTEKRRSLRKLLAKKLQNGKRSPKENTDSRHGGESEHPPVAGEVSAPELAVAAAPAENTAPPPEPDKRRGRRRGGAMPLAAFVPLVLVGLVAGKLPAVALTVLCAVFFSSVERVPSGHGRE